jgi:hypothetical protein
MSKMGTAAAAIATVLILSGAAAPRPAAATTAGWMVGGTLLSTTKALSTSAVGGSEFELEVGSIRMTCGGSMNLTLPELVAPNRIVFKGGTITDCNRTSICRPDEDKINIGSLLGETTLDGSLGARVVFKEEKGGARPIFSWKWVGESCVFSGNAEIGGQITALLSTGQTEKESQWLSWTTTAASEELKPATTVRGSELLKLASGQPWSFL